MARTHNIELERTRCAGAFDLVWSPTGPLSPRRLCRSSWRFQEARKDDTKVAEITRVLRGSRPYILRNVSGHAAVVQCHPTPRPRRGTWWVAWFGLRLNGGQKQSGRCTTPPAFAFRTRHRIVRTDCRPFPLEWSSVSGG